MKIIFYLSFLFISINSHSQSTDSLAIVDIPVTFNQNEKALINTTYYFSPKPSRIIGITIPFFTNWTFGYPFTSMDQSIFIFKQKTPSITFRGRFDFSFITYNLAYLEPEKYAFPGEINLLWTTYKNSTTVRETIQKKYVVGEFSNGDMITVAQIITKVPVRVTTGQNIGLFIRNQHSLNGIPQLNLGVTLGITKRSYVYMTSKITSSLKGRTNWNPKHQIIDRIFYANFTIIPISKFMDDYVINTVDNPKPKRIPVGGHIGWLINSRTKSKLFDSWNIETGIHGPIYIQNFSTNGKIPTPLFFLSLKGYICGSNYKI